MEKARSLLPLLSGDEEGRDLIDARQACAEGRREDAESILAGLDLNQSPVELATVQWHLYQMLGRVDDAARVLKPYETFEAPLALGNYLIYPQFDPTPFPVVQSIMKREGIIRGEPVRPTFECPEIAASLGVDHVVEG